VCSGRASQAVKQKGLEQSFVTLGRDELKGSAGLVPGGEMGGEVANKDEHVYIDVLLLFN
jgi:hypothetical protein